MRARTYRVSSLLQLVYAEYKPTSRGRELVLAFAVRLSLPAPRAVGSAFSPSRTPMVFCRPLRAGLAG